MKKIDLEDMSIDDLWTLHEKVSNILSTRIASEKHELEKRLAYLNRGADAIMQGTRIWHPAMRAKPAGDIPEFFPSIAIHRPRTRRGPGGESSPAGWSQPSRPAARSMISELAPRAIREDDARAGECRAAVWDPRRDAAVFLASTCRRWRSPWNVRLLSTPAAVPPGAMLNAKTVPGHDAKPVAGSGIELARCR